ncbi:MAG: type I-E CRISPR-associated protein Cas6/Cse3/CasE [Lachnospiraceae bacterium]|nr:type I-E CRISPR-associated protein Cas6/Cse3/CasE [Lachnospiraceae bacterium]
MYLTRVHLNEKRRGTMRALSCPAMIHGAVESAFPGERRRRLWRIDRMEDVWYLLVLSEDKPDMKNVVDQFGFPGEAPQWETRSYEPLLNRIQPQSNWHFRLTANPTRSSAAEAGSGGRGKVHNHVTIEQQKKWLMDRAESHGFRLNEDDFTITFREWNVFHKKGNRGPKVSILSVTYEGNLTVTDTEQFCDTLTEGIGRGKAYGMGMLTVATPRGNNHE